MNFTRKVHARNLFFQCVPSDARFGSLPAQAKNPAPQLTCLVGDKNVRVTGGNIVNLLSTRPVLIKIPDHPQDRGGIIVKT